MAIVQNIRQLWSPIIHKNNDMSITKLTKNFYKSIWASLLFIFTFLYYAASKPEKLTLKMSKTAQKCSQMKIPKFARKKFFNLYSKYYKVKLDEIIDPMDSFQTFSQFFTRRVKPRQIIRVPKMLLSPADSKILKISEIQNDQCSIIKGASYSLGQLLTGTPKKFTKQEINSLKQKSSNKLYQVIFYLAPGDYHRFHSPTDIHINNKRSIGGILLSVNEKTLLKKKKVYQRNGRLVVEGKWSPQSEALYINMIMVGALNVGRISVKENTSFKKGEQLGYFNLGSTIVMIFEAQGIKQWHKNQNDKIRYGDIVCEII